MTIILSFPATAPQHIIICVGILGVGQIHTTTYNIPVHVSNVVWDGVPGVDRLLHSASHPKNNRDNTQRTVRHIACSGFAVVTTGANCRVHQEEELRHTVSLYRQTAAHIMHVSYDMYKHICGETFGIGGIFFFPTGPNHRGGKRTENTRVYC